ncbi:hypothetical protein LEP1GSC021_2703 [Leptospira noguchii str. 1993005606]|nr:hypothetical protein LEP1GSC021_2703 [Leptospira noguchii str. 1993005606]
MAGRLGVLLYQKIILFASKKAHLYFWLGRFFSIRKLYFLQVQKSEHFKNLHF